MFEAIRDYTEPFAEKIGLVVHDVRTGAVFSRNPDRVFPSASVIKLAILWEFYRRVAEGSLNPEEPYVLHDDVKEGTTPYDTGILRDFHDGLVLTLQDIVTMMIVISDDTATNILIDRFGKEAINESMSRIGLTHTRVQRRMMEYDKVRAGIDNEISAGDMDRYFTLLLAQDSPMPAGCRETMLDILARQRYTAAIPSLLSEDTRIAHKTGTIGEVGLEHDVGLIYGPDGRPAVIVAALTQHLENRLHVIGTIAKMALESSLC